MTTLAIVLAVISIIICVALIILVILQQDNAQGLGSLAGSTETFFGKNKGRAIDSTFKKLTIALVLIFIGLTLALNGLTTV